MAIVNKDIADYKSNSTNSDGGAISANKLARTQLSADASAGDNSITVNDTDEFSDGDNLVIGAGSSFNPRVAEDITSSTVIDLEGNLDTDFESGSPIAVDNELFPDVSGSSADSGTTVYRKIYRKNDNLSDTFSGLNLWIANQPEFGEFSMGIGINHAGDSEGAQGNLLGLSTADKLTLVSDGADTRVVTILGISSGELTTEDVTLTGTSPVDSVNTYSQIYHLFVATTSARVVTIKEKISTTTIGTIGVSKKIAFTWFSGEEIAGDSEIGNLTLLNSLTFTDLDPGDSIPIWIKYVCAANTPAEPFTRLDLRIAGG